MHTYQMIIIAGVWLSLNHMMKINRDRARHQKTISACQELAKNEGKPVELLKEDKPASPVKVEKDEPAKSADAKK